MKLNNFFEKNRSKFFVCLIFFSLLSRILALGYVNKVIFDEVHFGKFITQYLKGEYFFDIHPPLGKLLLAGIAKFVKLSPSTSFAHIGLPFPPYTPIAPMRFLPALMGALLVITVFLLTEKITQSSRAGFISAMAILFDNALIAQSRFISLDTTMLFFITLAIYAYLMSEQTRKKFWLILSGISGAIAVSIKWIGLIGLAVVYILILWNYISIRRIPYKLSFKNICFIIFTLFFIPFIIYYSTFAIHFNLLKKPGDGNAFMSQAFNAPFYSSDKTVKELPLFKKFTELNIVMYKANLQNLKHTYSSKWFTWPLMLRPISYLHLSMGNDLVQNITFLGNPFVWWLSTLGMLAFIILIFLKKFFPYRFKEIPEFPNKRIILLGYIISYLPFISISRCMFLYHYLPALIFSIIATAMLIDKFLLPEDREIPSPFPSIVTLITFLPIVVLISRAVYLLYLPREIPFLLGIFFIILSSLLSLFFYFKAKNIYRISNLWLLVIFLLILGGFFIFMPLSYGIPIKGKTFEFYMWIKSWI